MLSCLPNFAADHIWRFELRARWRRWRIAGALFSKKVVVCIRRFPRSGNADLRDRLEPCNFEQNWSGG
jgi:hypothetical protein